MASENDQRERANSMDKLAVGPAVFAGAAVLAIATTAKATPGEGVTSTMSSGKDSR